MTIRAANNLCKRGTYSSFLQVKRIACFLLLLLQKLHIQFKNKKKWLFILYPIVA
jgi:hypothetical protein